MINPTKLTFIAALALGAVSARAETTAFVAPVAGHLSFGQAPYSDQTSYGLTVGALFGADQAHEFSVEWTTAQTRYVRTPPPDVMGASYDQVRGRMHPLLFGYRYHFGPAESRLRFFAGPIAGFTRSTGHGMHDAPVSIGPFTGDFSHWAVSFGGSAGAEFELVTGLSVQLGYRYLHIDSPLDFDGTRIEGPEHRRIELGSADTHFAFASLRWSF